MSDRPNLIVDLIFNFSLQIISFTEKLETQRKFNMANQLFRSGTSIGANVAKHKGHKVKMILSTNVK
jgi:four helix bundle protein